MDDLDREIEYFGDLLRDAETNVAPSALLAARTVQSDTATLAQAFDAFEQRHQADIDITRFFKDGRISAAPYGIRHERRPAGGTGVKGIQYLDGDFGFVLTHQANPIASAQFIAEHGGILINQIQGITGTQELLAPIHWQRALLYATARWADKNGVASVRVQPAHQNRWVKEGKLPLERATLLYDVAAKRAGGKPLSDGSIQLIPGTLLKYQAA